MIATPVACVVDASVGVKLVLAEALSDKAEALFEHLARDPAARFHVPDLFDVECANVLWKHVQRSGLPLADAQADLSILTALALQRIEVTMLVSDALAIAADHGISAYDASYVAASHRLQLPLITADARLANRMSGTPYAVHFLGGLTIPALPP
jgi:predicted nucleic acid-binding protein